MASIIPTNTSFLYPSLGNNTQPQPNSKTSAVAAKALSNSTWYADVPTENESQSDSAALSLHNTAQNTPSALSPPPKKRPIPLPRSSKTSLSTIKDPSKPVSSQTKNPLGTGLLGAVLKAKSGLKKTESNNSNPLSKTPPLSPPQENKPKKGIVTTTPSPDIIHNSLEYNPQNEDASRLSKIENDLRPEIEELNKVLRNLGIEIV